MATIGFLTKSWNSFAECCDCRPNQCPEKWSSRDPFSRSHVPNKRFAIYIRWRYRLSWLRGDVLLCPSRGLRYGKISQVSWSLLLVLSSELIDTLGTYCYIATWMSRTTVYNSLEILIGFVENVITLTRGHNGDNYNYYIICCAQCSGRQVDQSGIWP